MEGGSGGEIELPFSPLFFCFSSVLGAELSLSFSQPKSNNSCDRRSGERWYVGFWVFKAKNKRGLSPKLLIPLGLESGREMVL